MLKFVQAVRNIGGRFADRNRQTGEKGTRIESPEFNAMFFELSNLVAAAGITHNGDDETQVTQAVIALIKQQGAVTAFKVEMSQSPQSFNLTTFGIPAGNYAASLAVEGPNPNDVSLSFEIVDTRLTLYAWYTNNEGLRVKGVPFYRTGGGWGKPFGRPYAGTVEGQKVKVFIILTALEQRGIV